MKKIVLIGDSIRQGYDKYVKLAFENTSEVFFTNDNCRFTTYIIRHLPDWKNEFGCGDDVDLVHFNAGLWDDLVMLDGKNLVSLETYKENIDRICKLIKIYFPKAKLIFATSTPVQEHLFGEIKRFNADTEKYNAAACEIVINNGGTVNDLYTLMVNAPVEYHSDLTHYYTKEGTRIITNQVIEYIEKALDIKAEPLDYDALFDKKNDAEGI